MKAGVLTKPSLTSLPASASILGGLDEVVCVKEFGGSLFPKAESISVEGLEYKRAIEAAVQALLDHNIDVLVTIGGDGLASYAASALIKLKDRKTLMLGIAAGTANVGPIARPFGSQSIELLKPVSLDAIEVCDGDKVVGYGFNDLIIGDTFLGTLDDKVVNFSARALAQQDKLVVQEPSEDIFTDSFTLKLNGRKLDIDNPRRFKQACASTLNGQSLSGRAIFGGLINAAGKAHPAAFAMADRILVDSRQENWGYKGIVSSSTVCFESGDEIVLEGLADKAQLIIDGNPFARTSQLVRLRCAAGAIRALEAENEEA